MTPQSDFLMRNREIQRRSRARRKDYIEDLEKRVQQYERYGVQATTEVQAAARKVAEENYWLHSLLAKHGIATAEIKVHLDESRVAARSLSSGLAEVSRRNTQLHKRIDCPGPQPSALVVQSSTGPSASDMMPSASGLGLMSPTSIGSSPDYESVPYTIRNPPHLEDAQPRHTRTETISNRPCLEGPEARSTPCLACDQEDPIRGADETSCEDAARIIASMRGHEDAEGVWPELGCNAKRKCMVKNMTIFQMVDEKQ